MQQKDIYEVDLSQANSNKVIKKGLCVILSNNEMKSLPLKIIAPIIKYKDSYNGILWLIKIDPDDVNNIKSTCAIDIFQLRSISEKRFVKKIGEISDDDFKKCIKAINLVFGIY